MLVLSRKQGQSIVIGNDITITVKEIRGKTVRLSIQTGAGVPVYREEIHREIVEENRRAALQMDPADERLSTPELIFGPDSRKEAGQ